MAAARTDYLKMQTEFGRLLERVAPHNETSTPNAVLAHYLVLCLRTYHQTVDTRDFWLEHSVKVLPPVEQDD